MKGKLLECKKSGDAFMLVTLAELMFDKKPSLLFGFDGPAQQKKSENSK